MAKRSKNCGLKSSSISNYFPVVQEKSKIETPAKKSTPIDFYEKCLSDQFFQINQDNHSENENELISFIEVEESFGEKVVMMKNARTRYSFRNCFSVQFLTTVPVLFIFQKIALNNEVTRLDAELHKAKKMLRTALQINLQKDLKLQHMENKLTVEGINIDFNDFVAGDFNRFIKIFTEKELASLRGLPISQSSDSSFLRLILNYLYKDDLAIIAQKTVIGRNAANDAISPKKLVIMQRIFEERIDGLGLDEEANEKRKKRFVAVVGKIIGKERTKKKLF